MLSPNLLAPIVGQESSQPNIMNSMGGADPTVGQGNTLPSGNPGGIPGFGELQNTAQPGPPGLSSQPNMMTSSGVDNSGAFMAGHSQIQNQGSSPWNVLFEPVNHDPFNQQAMPLATGGGMYKP